MLVELRLKQFRSYADDSFEFSSGVNIVVGPNASGKTNLIEAILVLSRGKSYRVKDSELIQNDKPWARLDARLQSGNQRSYKIEREPQHKQYVIDGKEYKRLSHSTRLPVVLFEPNHLLLLSGSPESRRTYLDDLLEQTVSGYGTVLRSYKRTLAQRNALLKQNPNIKQLFPWDVRLSQLAGQIVAARERIIHHINTSLTDTYQALSKSKTKVTLNYSSQWPVAGYETKLLAALEAQAELDAARGFTGSGPHRDDLLILFDGRPASDTASRGEARTALLGLKMTELAMLEAVYDTRPILLLDDVFSELDGSRRHALTEQLHNYQTFITTTDADVVLQHFTDKCNIIPLSTQ